MIQELNKIQTERSDAEPWREELARRQCYEDAAIKRDKERLLHRELARLRLKLMLGRAIEKE